jgi:hypothetical protein
MTAMISLVNSEIQPGILLLYANRGSSQAECEFSREINSFLCNPLVKIVVVCPKTAGMKLRTWHLRILRVALWQHGNMAMENQ